ncbi:MAG TPA: class I SAM-dependent methyltransferase [Flavobacteriales bacterium]|jgi:SAM-dependent methyltransferase|nr:class I SAM-dependent methyltransferase [Flavobacteriales bacterium]
MERHAQAIRIFDQAAQIYQDRYMDVSMYQRSLDRFCAELPTQAEVLELACGPGNLTRNLLERRPDLRILGTDLSPRMLELARANNPNATFELLDARGIATLQRHFDGVACGFCLPYLMPEETEALIRDAAQALRPKGVLYLSTMEDDPAQSGLKASSAIEGEFVHVQYYEAAWLTQVLARHGFTVLDLFRTSYVLHGRDTTDLVLVARR